MDVVATAIEKIQSLSPERAARVVSLIDDLAELEAREAAEDLDAARQSLADYQKTGKAISLDDLEKRLGVF